MNDEQLSTGAAATLGGIGAAVVVIFIGAIIWGGSRGNGAAQPQQAEPAAHEQPAEPGRSIFGDEPEPEPARALDEQPRAMVQPRLHAEAYDRFDVRWAWYREVLEGRGLRFVGNEAYGKAGGATVIPRGGFLALDLLLERPFSMDDLQSLEALFFPLPFDTADTAQVLRAYRRAVWRLTWAIDREITFGSEGRVLEGYATAGRFAVCVSVMQPTEETPEWFTRLLIVYLPWVDHLEVIDPEQAELARMRSRHYAGLYAGENVARATLGGLQVFHPHLGNAARIFHELTTTKRAARWGVQRP